MHIFKPNAAASPTHAIEVSVAHALKAFFERHARTAGADGFDPAFAAAVDWDVVARQELARRALQALPDEAVRYLASPQARMDRVIAMAQGEAPMAAPCRLMPWLEARLSARFGPAAPIALQTALEPFEHLLGEEVARPLVAIIAEAAGAPEAAEPVGEPPEVPREVFVEVVDACEAVIDALGWEQLRSRVPARPAASALRFG